jgi:Uma2 family endonuclease
MTTAVQLPRETEGEPPGYPQPPSRWMSEEDFVRWAVANRVRAEWVEGEVIVMAPANLEHADLNGWVYMLLRLYVEKRQLGRVIFDVFTRLAVPRRQLRVPDVLYISNDRLGIAQETRIEGAPDLIIEIVSPDSPSRDWREKHAEYAAAGVREYWVLDPLHKAVEASALNAQGGYQRIEEVDGRIQSVVVPGWYLRPVWLWQQPRPIVFDILGEYGIK